jgi:ribonuclease BN (tRNA processing enzyme)
MRALAARFLVLAAATAAGCARGGSGGDAASERPPDAAGGSKTLVVLLGTGTPNPDPLASGPSVAVVTGGRAYVVDVGPGVVRRASAAFLGGIGALRPEGLTRAFVTHLHSDHTAGYADFILTPWAVGRSEPLHVYGPPGLEAMTDAILEAYREDIAVRLEGGEPDMQKGDLVVVHEVTAGPVYKDAFVRVEAFAVSHGAWKHAYGYRFEAADRTIVISGDSAASESVIDACGGCDVLVHEVYSTAGFQGRPADWQAYHAGSHTSAAQLAALASKAKPKLLVLYHQLLWGATPQELIDEIEQGYGGKVVFGRDLDVY